MDLGARALGPYGVFLKGALENPGMVGALFPSSRATITGMLKNVDWAKAKLVVEYGPGVGTFTRPILSRLPADAKLIAIDTNAHFIDYLNQEICDPRLQAVLGSAADVERIVKKAGFDKADVIISGLPFSSLPGSLGKQIVEASYRVMAPGGAFLTYQYRLSARRLTEQVFDRVDTKVTWANIPPNNLTWGWKAA
ncbi:methyltransferase domain-containing protein [Erythrobacter sp. SCSIO 43205]|nr:methyltransferase domain-containing protein [Erythrobacter sp. SCSIO 43205]